jgi:hypothetical protein
MVGGEREPVELPVLAQKQGFHGLAGAHAHPRDIWIAGLRRSR